MSSLDLEHDDDDARYAASFAHEAFDDGLSDPCGFGMVDASWDAVDGVLSELDGIVEVID